MAVAAPKMEMDIKIDEEEYGGYEEVGKKDGKQDKNKIQEYPISYICPHRQPFALFFFFCWRGGTNRGLYGPHQQPFNGR